MSILLEICNRHSKWVRMAQKFDYDNAEDLVQEMYLKIHNLNPTEVNEVYIYRTIKSIFLDDFRKKKLMAFLLRGGDIPDIADESEIEDELKLSYWHRMRFYAISLFLIEYKNIKKHIIICF